MIASVFAAFCDSGGLKAETPLLTASTPVSAEQPLAKARSNTNKPRVSPACGSTRSVGRRRFAGSVGSVPIGVMCPPLRTKRMRVVTIIAPTRLMNAYSGNAKTKPDSLVPRRLATVMTTTSTTAISTRQGSRKR